MKSLSRTVILIYALTSLTTSLFADGLPTQLKEIETKAGARLGVAAVDTGNGKKIEYRAHERFPMCSTFKLLAAAAVLHRVDQKQEQLSRFITYTKADLLEYAPVTKEHVHEGGMSLESLCGAAIEQSDNTAGNLLLKTIGGPEGLTRYARALGDEKTHLDRMEPDLNTAVPGDERDTTTPAAMLGNLRALLIESALSATSREKLDLWLAHNETGADLIRAGVPNDWKVGDKTGRGAHGSRNDIAILRPPGKAPILLAIYSVGSDRSPTAGSEMIVAVTRLVIDTFKE
jgi:beta-lactamase class A